MAVTRKILLTGGAGFVGANLSLDLLAEGHEVHLLSRPRSDWSRLGTARRHFQMQEVDLGDRPGLSKLVDRLRPDWIFHLAAHGAYSWQTDPEAMIATNVTGAVNLIDACCAAGFAAFIQAGSSSEYGFKSHPPSEDERVEPNSCYAVTKAAATHYGSLQARRHRLPLRTLRLYSVYGPREDPRRLIPTLIRLGREGRLPPLVHPDSAHDFVHVRDVVRAFKQAAHLAPDRGGDVYNIGSGRQTALRDVVAAVRRQLDIAAEPQWCTMPDRPWDARAWAADSRRALRDLQWRAELDFDAGLAAAIAWFDEHHREEPRGA